MAETPVRESGRTQADEVTEEVAASADEEIGAEDPSDVADDMKRFRTPGFQRMRIEWRSEDRPVIRRVKEVVNGAVLREFADAYQIMNDLFEVVRTPERDENDEPITDAFGYVVWKRLPNGSYEEDWGRLTKNEKEHYLFAISTRLFDWELRAADLWGEAMLAKGIWEERFSIDYSAPVDGTIEDRTAYAKVHSRDERYFAIYTAYLSRRADVVTRTMNALARQLSSSLASH